VQLQRLIKQMAARAFISTSEQQQRACDKQNSSLQHEQKESDV
jgi:hypothetical protein